MGDNPRKKDTILTDRKTWIDIYKGIAIILVVVGHLKVSDNLYRFIYTFHMYAFFFVSGITYRTKAKNFMAAILTNVKWLYIPYLLFAFMWNFTNMLWMYGTTFYRCISLENILGVVLNYELVDTVSVGPAWFLCSLLIVKLIYDFLQRLLRKRVIITITCSVLFLVGAWINGKIELPFSVLPSLTSILFFHLGNMSKGITLHIKKCKYQIQIISSIILFVLTYILSMHHDKHLILASNDLPKNVFLLFATAMLGCMGLVFLSLLLDSLPYVNELFQYCGVNSLIIMGVHSEIRVFAYFIIDHLGFAASMGNAWIIFLITLIVCVPIVFIFKKFPILLGKA